MGTKTALVTGGTSGIGLSIVRALAQSGASVHFIGTNEDKGKRIEAELNAGGTAHSRFVRLDLSRLRDVHDFAARFGAEVEALDVLVNVAGVMPPTRTETDEGFEKTFAVDHLSAVVLVQQLTPQLGRARYGRVVNVSGPPSQMLEPRLDFEDLQLHEAYSSIRAVANALHAKTVITEVLAERLAADGIDVNAFDAGAVKSELGRDLSFPLNLVLGFVQLFMPRRSKTGIYASTSDALNGVTGQFIVGRTHRPLAFARDYKDRLWNATEAMLEQALVPG